ncbi:MAG: DEAD/DEAH box helicase [Limnochordales bacterium]|nr:DEAD/DEAH box helicase [Limnochordales bacterium]
MGHSSRGRREKAGPVLVTHYRHLTLDEFQTRAIMHLNQATSTLVCAPTGSGKTLIADYLVEKTLADGGRLIYTGPIKALVNQKYREFRKRFGQQNVGILTGDISYQTDAPLLLMTAEVLRNLLLRKQQDRRLSGLAWVILDEIHYLGHPTRGTVWEEIILLLPRGVHILGLSATIANGRELAGWIAAVQGEPCSLVVSSERSVPLVHLYFNNACGAVDLPGLLTAFSDSIFPDRDELDTKAETIPGTEMAAHLRHRLVMQRLSPEVEPVRRTTHLDLVQFIQQERLFPTLYFVFSRRGTEERAAELARRRDFLRPVEKETVRVTVKQTLDQLGLEPAQIPDLPVLLELWRRGIAYHHAGLLPAVKRIVENLLERRVLRVLYATETFAVGVNMPVRSVCFDSLVKQTGTGTRFLTRQEYLQMAGRAGRRGLDRVGTVISRIDFADLARWLARSDFERILPLTDWDSVLPEPVNSQLHLSYSLVLNLTLERGVQGVRELLQKSLAVHQQRRTEGGSGPPPTLTSLLNEYLRRLRVLEVLGHIAFPDACAFPDLLPRGEISRNLYVRELLVAELLYEGIPQRLTPPELAGLSAALAYEESDPEGGLHLRLHPPGWWGEVSAVADRLRRTARTAHLTLAEDEDLYLCVPVAAPVQAWAAGASLLEILQEWGLEPGDLFFICRQAIDLLRQMATALPHDRRLQANVAAALAGLDRDVVQVRL